MKVADYLDRVTTLYNDKEYVRIPKTSYLKFLDDAIAQLVLSRPDSHVKTSVVQLIKGTRQEIPSEGFALIDVYMNKIKNGSTYDNGAPVYQVERKDLDYFSNWHSGNKNPTKILEFSFDPRSPRTFWVSPAVGNNVIYVEMDYSYGVPPMTSDNTEVPISDVFSNAIVSYMLFLAYSTDSTSANDRVIAQKYESSFYQSLGIEYKAALIVVPKVDDSKITGVASTDG